MAGTSDWLGVLLGVVGGVVGSIVPGIGTVAGAGIGTGLGAGLGGLFDDTSSDPTKSADQANMRRLAMLLEQSPTGNADMFNQLNAQMAGRGLGNSGAAASGYGALLAGLQGQRNQNYLQASGIYNNVGATPVSTASQGGDALSNALLGIINSGAFNKPAPVVGKS